MTALDSTHAERNVRPAWLLAGLWTGVILLAGSDLGSHDTTSRFLAPFLRWLLPDASQAGLDQLYFTIRKAAHVTEYAVLAVLARWAWRSRSSAAAWRCAAALAWVVAVAAVDEGRQAFSAERTGSLGDVALDFAGGILALAIAIAYTGAMHSRRRGRDRR